MPADMVMEVLGTAAGDVLLIGGQALAVWARHFGVVRTDRYDITRDVDFLVTDPDDRAMVRRFAQALGGQSVFPHPRNAMTALVGSAYKEVGDSTYNVDVLFRVFGMVREDVERNSVTMETAGRNRELDGIRPRLAELEGELAKLEQAATAWLAC